MLSMLAKRLGELTSTSRTSGVRIRSRISWAMRSPTFTVEIVKWIYRGRGRARDANGREGEVGQRSRHESVRAGCGHWRPESAWSTFGCGRVVWGNIDPKSIS